jgi:hypothetical protein
MVTIRPVQTKRDLKRFIDFPHHLYQGDSNYVPKLYSVQKQIFNQKKYPFFSHSSARFFLAFKDGQVAGRIVAIKNNNHNRYHDDSAGFFGFFETIKDFQVAQGLFAAAGQWLKAEGLASMIGPENYSTNDSCGFLVDGFDKPPVIMMPYNKSYYPEFVARYGFEKVMDLYAYRFGAAAIHQSLGGLSKRIEEQLNKRGIIIRSIDFKKLQQDIMGIREVYNAASGNNWGFVPLTEEEFRHQADNIRTVIRSRPDFILVAQIKQTGQIIGYSCSLPDINQVLAKLKRGRLFPFGIFKFLIGRKRIDGARVMILGIMDKYRHMGIAECFCVKITSILVSQNIVSAEASYVMETNHSMNRVLAKIGGRIYKRFRIYEYKIPDFI